MCVIKEWGATEASELAGRTARPRARMILPSAALAHYDEDPPMPDPTPAADRNLLFGIVALQMDFVGRDALVAAMNAWVLEKSKPLGQILEVQKALTRSRRVILDALVDEHVRQHGGDPARSLAALSSVDTARSAFGAVADSEVQASLGHLRSLPAGGAGESGLETRIGPELASTGGFETRVGSEASASGAFEPGAGAGSSASRRFRIIRPHAKGGLGIVHVALDGELNRHVALKEIQAHHADHPESRARFVVEAEITGGLEHPGIVPVYSLGHDPTGRPFYAMRFIEGDSLKEAIDRFHDPAADRDPGRRHLELQKLLRRFLDVCQAIAYAHSKGVLHRDLKPGNIMVGKYGETLVVDWGLAKMMGTPETSGETALRPSASGSGTGETLPGSAVGTPAYMSPEQAEGRLDLLGPASDVYSLGATFHALLTGRSPVDGPDVATVLERVRRGEVSPPRQVDPAVPPPLDAICRKAMALKPEDRYSTPHALAGDVEAWLADEPVAAWPDPWAVRARRWVRHHQKLVVGASTAALVALISLAGLAAVISVANRNLNLANDQIRDQVVEIARQNTELERTNQNLTAANTTITGQKNRLQAINADLAAANDTIKGQNTRLEAINAELADANATIQGQNAELERTNQNLTAANATIQGQNAELERTNADLEVARDEAARERDQAKAVTDFLVSSFRKSDPSEDGREVTIAEVLDRAAEELDDSNIAAITRAEILNAIGGTYSGLGLVTEAVELNEKALEIRLLVLGADDLDTLSSQNNLAAAYLAAGRLKEALPLFEATLEARQAQLGKDHPETIISQDNLALAYESAGRVSEALPLYERNLEALRANLGADHPDTLTTQNNLALAYESAGHLAEALPLLERTLEARRAQLGADHPDTLSSQNSLAFAYGAAGRVEEALPLYKRTLEAMRAKLGVDHPETLNVQNNLATAYKSAGDLAEALPMLERTLEARRVQLGADHPDTLTSQNNLAFAYKKAGRVEEALPLYERTLEAMRTQLGANHPDTLTTQNNLALAYESAGDLAEALPMLERTLEARRAQLGVDHPDTLTSQANLATAYEAADRVEEALPLYERTLEAMRAKLGANHPDTLTTQNNLAYAYESAGHLAEALPLLKRTLEVTRAKFGADHQETLISQNKLAFAYYRAGRVSEGLPLFERMVEALRARLGDEAPATLNSIYNLANVYYAAGQPAEALPLLREFVGAVRRQEPLDEAKLGLALVGLGDILNQTGHYDEAEAVLREGLEIWDRLQSGQWNTMNARSLLGESLAGLGRFEEAEALLLAGQSGLEAQADAIPPGDRESLQVDAIARLARLYGAWGKPSEAARWRAKLPAEAATATLPNLPADVFARP